MPVLGEEVEEAVEVVLGVQAKPPDGPASFRLPGEIAELSVCATRSVAMSTSCCLSGIRGKCIY